MKSSHHSSITFAKKQNYSIELKTMITMSQQYEHKKLCDNKIACASCHQSHHKKQRSRLVTKDISIKPQNTSNFLSNDFVVNRKTKAYHKVKKKAFLFLL